MAAFFCRRYSARSTQTCCRRIASCGFEEQDAAYKAEVLPNKAITTAFEAGATGLWYKYADKVLGVDSFGESAPAPQVFEVKGITKDNLVKVVKA